MCLNDMCEEIQRQSVLMELERVRPEAPCMTCAEHGACFWHPNGQATQPLSLTGG